MLKMKMLRQAVQEASQPVSAGFSVREQLQRCGHAVTREEEAVLGTFVGTVFMSINCQHQYLEQRKALPLPAVWVIASVHMAEFMSRRTHKLRTFFEPLSTALVASISSNAFAFVFHH